MKKLLLFALMVVAVAAVKAQEKPKLKDLLFGGKLKLDSSGVIRSTDDLSSKIDTTTKKETVTGKPETTVTNDLTKNSISVETKDSATTTVATVTPFRSNIKLWKDYNDSLAKTLKAEVLSARQIKKETYYLLFDYEIGTDGMVTVTDVTSTPANAYLQAEVKQVLDSYPLRLNPVFDSKGQAHKVKRKQSFTITKE